MEGLFLLSVDELRSDSIDMQQDIPAHLNKNNSNYLHLNSAFQVNDFEVRGPYEYFASCKLSFLPKRPFREDNNWTPKKKREL